MNKTARFSIALMMVAGLATIVSAGQVGEVDVKPQHTGAITQFLGDMVHPNSPTNNTVGVPQSGAMQHAPHGVPQGDQRLVPFMGQQQGSPMGAPHAPYFEQGSPNDTLFQQGAQTPCDKGVAPQR